MFGDEVKSSVSHRLETSAGCSGAEVWVIWMNKQEFS